MRRAAKVDANQPDIVKALRDAGCVVGVTSHIGNGFPDIVAYHPRVNRVRFMEIKDGAKPPSARKLTEAEAEFARAWGEHCVTVTSAEEALLALGVGMA